MNIQRLKLGLGKLVFIQIGNDDIRLFGKQAAKQINAPAKMQVDGFRQMQRLELSNHTADI